MRSIEVSSKDRPESVDAGPAPMLQWLKIDALVIDDSYQRELKPGNWKAIRAIAAQFSWSRFSPVFVAPVEGGRYAIIDGQHRTHAAAMCGFAEVPCQIVQMTPEEQAASFAAVNGLVTKVTLWQIFKASLAAGEPWAAEMARIADAAGCKVMTSNTSHFLKQPCEIYAIASFRHLCATYPAEAIVAALCVLTQAEGWNDNAEAWDNNLLYPVLMALCARPHATIRAGFVEAFEEWDVWAEVDMIDAENKRRRKLGLPYIGKKEQLQQVLTDWLDRKFPARMALPKAVPA